jgi:cell division protein ZapA
MKQVDVTILGQGYVLGCPDGGEERLRAAVAIVDREMGAIRDAGKTRARERIAVLAALNLAYQLAQGRAETPAATEAAAGDGDGTAAVEPSDGSGQAEPDLQALVARLDAALQRDGHLI